MIRQRILYVGIGGSGLDLGIELDKAMRREICGLDGRSLVKRGGAFAGLKPNQLPQFIQSLYIDFAAESLASVTKDIELGNARAAMNLVPTVDNYPSLATDLRLKVKPELSWIPASTGEPQIKPLNAGAGQFPTVGRAAFFGSIESQGYKKAIGVDLQAVIGQLDLSLGQLDAYTNQNSISDLAVYVGFSMSGGTGCGVFLDVLQLLIYELHAKMQRVNTVILPVVMMPSTFDGLLPPDNARRASLNAARALLDLTELIEQLSAPNPSRAAEFKIKYPDASLGTNGEVSIEFLAKAPDIPVATLVSKPTIMARSDVARSVAASIIAQSSSIKRVKNASTAVGGEAVNKNSFTEWIINSRLETSKIHRLGLGRHPLMPMVSSSLTMPSRKIADIVAKRIIADGLKEIQDQLSRRVAPTEVEINDAIISLGFHCMIKPETFDTDTTLTFEPAKLPKNQGDLDSLLARLRSNINKAMPIIETQILKTINQKSVFQLHDGLIDYLTKKSSDGETDILSALNVFSSAISKLEVNQASIAANKTADSKAGRAKRSLFPKRLSAAAVRVAFDKERKDFEARVMEKWWSVWANNSQAHLQSIESSKLRINELTKLMKDFISEIDGETAEGYAEISKTRVGVINFVPTNGRPVPEALSQLVIETAAQIRKSYRLEDQSATALLRRLGGQQNENAWALMVEKLSKRGTKTQVIDALLEPVTNAVDQAMTGSEAIPGTLPKLGKLLDDAARKDDSDHARTLRAILGSLVPDEMVPSGEYRFAKVLISYPGEENDAVERLIQECLNLSKSFAALRIQETEFLASGETDVVTVNINLIGQGLLDNPETRQILHRWKDAINSNIDDKLNWRQRKGYKNIDRIFLGNNQVVVLNSLLRGLVGGIIKLEDGEDNSPAVLSISSENARDEAPIMLEIPSLPGFSSWANLCIAYENAVLEADIRVDHAGTIIESMLNFVPVCLDGDKCEIPQLFKSLLSLREGELTKLESALQSSKYAEKGKRELQNAIEFWRVSIPSAMELETTKTRLRNLVEALNHAEPGFRWN